MKTRKISILIICMCCIFLLTACQNTSPATGNDTAADNTSSTENTTTTPTQTEQQTILETEASTTPAVTNPRVVYVSVRPEYMHRYNIDSYEGCEYKSAVELVQETLYTQSVKENVPDIQIQDAGKTITLQYKSTNTKDVDNEMIRYYGTTDTYVSSKTSAAYSFYTDGKLESFRNRQLSIGKSNTPLKKEDAIAIAKEFLLEWYSEIPWDEYSFSAYTTQTGSIVTFQKRLLNYNSIEACSLWINTDGVVFEFSSTRLGICDYFKDITAEQIAQAETDLKKAINATAMSVAPVQPTLSIRDDGKLYLTMYADTWTYNDMGMLDEDSYQISVDFCTCVNP